MWKRCTYECKPICRYKKEELWSRKEGRKARLREAVSHTLKQWKPVLKMLFIENLSSKAAIL